MMRIVTKTPVHIGSGSRYGAMDAYVSGDNLYRVNMDSLFRKDTETVKRYINSIDSKNFTELQSILKNGYVRYSAKIRKGVNISQIEEEIHECVKDANGDIPYVPGSTLKGFIRTALIMKYLNDNNGRFSLSVAGDIREYNIISAMKNGIRDIWIRSLGSDNRQDIDLKNKKKIKKTFGKRFEDLIVYTGDIKPNRKGDLRFKYDAKYDIFKFLEVGDFYPKKYELWIDKATIFTQGQQGAHLFIESVEGEFEGDIKISPDISMAIKNKNLYPTIDEKIKILGIGREDIDNLENAESKMRKYVLSALEEFIKEVGKYSKKINKEFNAPQGANLRIGFGTGALYKTIWHYLMNNDKEIASYILRKMHGYRANVKSYPKSHYKLSDRRELGWVKLEEK